MDDGSHCRLDSVCAGWTCPIDERTHVAPSNRSLPHDRNLCRLNRLWNSPHPPPQSSELSGEMTLGDNAGSLPGGPAKSQGSCVLNTRSNSGSHPRGPAISKGFNNPYGRSMLQLVLPQKTPIVVVSSFIMNSTSWA